MNGWVRDTRLSRPLWDFLPTRRPAGCKLSSAPSYDRLRTSAYSAACCTRQIAYTVLYQLRRGLSILRGREVGKFGGCCVDGGASKVRPVCLRTWAGKRDTKAPRGTPGGGDAVRRCVGWMRQRPCAIRRSFSGCRRRRLPAPEAAAAAAGCPEWRKPPAAAVR